MLANAGEIWTAHGFLMGPPSDSEVGGCVDRQAGNVVDLKCYQSRL